MPIYHVSQREHVLPLNTEIHLRNPRIDEFAMGGDDDVQCALVELLWSNFMIEKILGKTASQSIGMSHN